MLKKYDMTWHCISLKSIDIVIIVVLIVHAVNILLKCIEKNTFFKIGEQFKQGSTYLFEVPT